MFLIIYEGNKEQLLREIYHLNLILISNQGNFEEQITKQTRLFRTSTHKHTHTFTHTHSHTHIHIDKHTHSQIYQNKYKHAILSSPTNEIKILRGSF